MVKNKQQPFSQSSKIDFMPSMSHMNSSMDKVHLPIILSIRLHKIKVQTG